PESRLERRHDRWLYHGSPAGNHEGRVRVLYYPVPLLYADLRRLCHDPDLPVVDLPVLAGRAVWSNRSRAGATDPQWPNAGHDVTGRSCCNRRVRTAPAASRARSESARLWHQL